MFSFPFSTNVALLPAAPMGVQETHGVICVAVDSGCNSAGLSEMSGKKLVRSTDLCTASLGAVAFMNVSFLTFRSLFSPPVVSP